MFNISEDNTAVNFVFFGIKITSAICVSIICVILLKLRHFITYNNVKILFKIIYRLIRNKKSETFEENCRNFLQKFWIFRYHPSIEGLYNPIIRADVLYDSLINLQALISELFNVDTDDNLAQEKIYIDIGSLIIVFFLFKFNKTSYIARKIMHIFVIILYICFFYNPLQKKNSLIPFTLIPNSECFICEFADIKTEAIFTHKCGKSLCSICADKCNNKCPNCREIFYFIR